MKKVLYFFIGAVFAVILITLGVKVTGINNSPNVVIIDVDSISPNNIVMENTLSELDRWYMSAEGMQEMMKGDRWDYWAE